MAVKNTTIFVNAIIYPPMHTCI